MQEAGHLSRLCPAGGFCYNAVLRLEEATCFPAKGEFEHVPKPNTNRGKSAIRSLRVARTRTLRNQAVRSAIKTFVKKTRAAIDEGGDSVTQLYQATSSLVDKAAKKGVIHKNAANRRKSRLARRVNAAKTAGAS